MRITTKHVAPLLAAFAIGGAVAIAPVERSYGRCPLHGRGRACGARRRNRSAGAIRPDQFVARL